jgi:hypothetical protein
MVASGSFSGGIKLEGLEADNPLKCSVGVLKVELYLHCFICLRAKVLN